VCAHRCPERGGHCEPTQTRQGALPRSGATAAATAAVAPADSTAGLGATRPLGLNIHPRVGEEKLAALYVTLCQMRQVFTARKSASDSAKRDGAAKCDAPKRNGAIRAFGNPVKPSSNALAPGGNLTRPFFKLAGSSADVPQRVPFADQGVVCAPNLAHASASGSGAHAGHATETIGRLWMKAVDAQSEQAERQHEANPLNAAFVAATACEANLHEAGVFDFEGADSSAFAGLLADEFDNLDELFSTDVWA